MTGCETASPLAPVACMPSLDLLLQVSWRTDEQKRAAGTGGRVEVVVGEFTGLAFLCCTVVF